MKSDVILNLDHPDGVYNAGDVIKGSVAVTLTQEVKAKALVVHFFGYGRVSWDEQRAYIKGSASTVSLKNSEHFLDQTIVLVKREREKNELRQCGRGSGCAPFLPSVNSESDECITLAAGQYTYPFEFTLPENLPSSYDGKWGAIRYTAKASLQRPWRDVDRERDLTINALLDLNDEPELVRPIGALGEFHNGLMCCTGYGLVNLEIRIRRRGYVVGEGIPFYVEIENQSGRKLHDAKVALAQHVTFKVGNKMKKTTHVMTSLNRGEIQPGVTHVWEGDSLVIPPNLPVSSNKLNKTIQVKYRVTLIIVHSTWSEEYTLPVNIVLGSVPLRKSTISSYLKLLGYCTAETPQGSPTTTPRLSKAPRLSITSGNPKLPLLPAGRGRQSVPAIHWSLDPRTGRRRCSAAVILDRPGRPRLGSESSTSGAARTSPIIERRVEARRKSHSKEKPVSVIEEEDTGSANSSGQSSKTSNRLTVPVVVT